MSLQILRDSYGTILCAIIIFSYILVNRKKYGKHITIMFAVIMSLSLVESVASSAERFLGNSAVYHPMRLVLSWLCYWVAPGILLLVAETIMRGSAVWKRWLIAIPEIVNVIVTSTAFFGPWCFSMEPAGNHFVRGPLIVIPRWLLR